MLQEFCEQAQHEQGLELFFLYWTRRYVLLNDLGLEGGTVVDCDYAVHHLVGVLFAFFLLVDYSTL